MCFLAIWIDTNTIFNRVVCRLSMPHLDVTHYSLQYNVMQTQAVQLSELETPPSAPVHKFPEKIRSPFKILSGRSVTCSRFHTERPQISGVTTQYVGARTDWVPASVQPFPEDGSYVLIEGFYKHMKGYLKVVCVPRWCSLGCGTSGQHQVT